MPCLSYVTPHNLPRTLQKPFITYPWKIQLLTAIQGVELWTGIDIGNYFPIFKVEVLYITSENQIRPVGFKHNLCFKVFNTGKYR